WRQKGTGRARAGALSVPHRRGGGVAFGPKPHKHVVKVNRKARRRALRSALSVHAARGSLAVIEGGDFSSPATKQAATVLAKWDTKRPTLLVVDPEETMLVKSFRNIRGVDVLPAGAAGVADLLGHPSVVISQAALSTLEARSAGVSRGAGEDSGEQG
ncbi:MAG: 50S ribosomal protein L4, partial [Solirubrobacterales bacterium]|nr:50S ribosomal protein L4 [Solirubrobacterales bacterium]